MNFRIQMYEDEQGRTSEILSFSSCLEEADTHEDPEMTVYEALDKGLKDLMDLCDVVTDKFTIAKMEWVQPETPNKNSARPDRPGPA
jgi:hypothetical protein